MKRFLLISIFLSLSILSRSATVRVRLFTGFSPSYTFFSVASGSYLVMPGTGTSFTLGPGDQLLIVRFSGKIAVRTKGERAFLADSIYIKGMTGADRFELRINTGDPAVRIYSGDLACYPDLGSLLLVNRCDLETYVAGVVKAEGGGGKNPEYFRTQAVIARTYTYKYYNKHIIDRYNLCDDTHCQAFTGVISDTAIINAVNHTTDLVIATPDSSLIISAFHSNCGGETSPSEYAWLTVVPYLARVNDPYCIGSRNASWEKTCSRDEWISALKINGYDNSSSGSPEFEFSQPSRVQNYVAGSFSMPLRALRENLGLRSTFFSVSTAGDSVILKGKGYGHGVGLCQEGAMVMANRGFTFSQIINFYYKGVIIINISSAKKTGNEKEGL